MELTCEVINKTTGPVIRLQIADRIGELWIDSQDFIDHSFRSSFKDVLGALYYLHPLKNRVSSPEKDDYLSTLHLPDKAIVYQFEFNRFYSSRQFDEEASVLFEAKTIGSIDSVIEMTYRTRPKGKVHWVNRFAVRLRYRDLCRVILTAFDRAIKNYGFLGLGNDSIDNDNFVMRHFLFLKAHLLDRLADLEIMTTNDEPKSDFMKECELLMVDL
jgi:hypothetical protein